MNRNGRVIALSSIALIFAACGGTDNDNNGSPDLGSASSNTIVDVAVATPQLSTLVAAVQNAGLVDTLKGTGPFTVFAPTNAAFTALKAAGVDATALDVPTLTAVLKYHVIGSAQLAAAISASTSQTTLGGTVKVSLRDGGVYLNGLTSITTTDVKASNGVVHIIDSVLLPDTSILDLVGIATAYPALSSLQAAVVQANLASALEATGPFTLFAPVSSAFAKLTSAPSAAQLPDILEYHVIPSAVDSTAALAAAQTAPPGNSVATLLTGKSVTLTLSGQALKVNDSTVTYTDIKAKNGIIHLIDTVLIPQ